MLNADYVVEPICLLALEAKIPVAPRVQKDKGSRHSAKGNIRMKSNRIGHGRSGEGGEQAVGRHRSAAPSRLARLRRSAG
jgi:hypothetical protein